MLSVTRSDNTKINYMDLFNRMLYNLGIYWAMCNCIIADRGDMTWMFNWFVACLWGYSIWLVGKLIVLLIWALWSMWVLCICYFSISWFLFHFHQLSFANYKLLFSLYIFIFLLIVITFFINFDKKSPILFIIISLSFNLLSFCFIFCYKTINSII